MLLSNMRAGRLMSVLVFLLLLLPAGNSLLRAESAIPVSEQQDRVLRGKVLDSAGEPVIGAFVVEVGQTTNGTVTDVDGSFSLTVAQGRQILVSCMGYADRTMTVGPANDITIVLEEDATALDEIVVIGYGTAKKSSLTGALSQVSDDSFKEQRVTRIDQALQGRAAGVQISNTGGAPGSEVRIRIRGANSILGDNSPLFVIDGFVGADFNDLNPNDIKSIEVLKDASSTAIYGSRGANGVILVTTKSGDKSSQVKLTYDGSVSVSSAPKLYDTMDAGTYARTANKFNVDKGGNPIFTEEELKKYDAMGRGFDYQDMVFRTALSHQHQIGLSGGTKDIQYRVSGNYLDQQGILEQSGYKRYTVRTNVNAKATEKLTVRFLANGSLSDASNNAGNYTGTSNLLTQALAWAPVTDPYDGKGGYTIVDPYGSLKSNPLSILYDHESKTRRMNVNVLGGVNYEILPGLTADFQAVADLSFINGKSWSGVYRTNYKPTASKNSNQIQTIQTTSQLSYNKRLGKHDINAVAVVETQRFRFESLSGSSDKLTFPDLKYDNLSLAETTTVGSDFSMWSLLSYIGRINYGYDNRYLVSLSVRRDGASKFAEKHKFSTFPAVAVAWNAHNESFLQGQEKISTLKLRASWGLTGSQAISPYATQDTYKTGNYYSFNNGVQTSGIAISNPGNPSLIWETTRQIDFGVEIGLLKDRFRVEADYFTKDTHDLLMGKSIPIYMGGGTITSNVGSIRNHGFEFSISGDIISKKDFVWNSSINASFVKNKVVDLGDEEYITSFTNFVGIQSIPESIYKVGESLGSIWGLNCLGYWTDAEATEAAKYNCVPGDVKYEDLNQDFKYDGNDCKIIGCGMPVATLGWNNTIQYKRFTVNAFFQGVLGQDKLNYTRFMGIAGVGDWHTPILSEAADTYSVSGNGAPLPGWSTTSIWYAQSSMFLEDASFLRLKNLSVSYDVPVKRLSALSVSLNAINLLTLTRYKGLDPEASNRGGGGSDISQGLDFGAYPNPRTFMLGVNITF